MRSISSLGGVEMENGFRRNWDGFAWQRYGLVLAQARHGAQNVQRVPDKVQGDGGLEFFTLNGCLYQCYAPEEPDNTAKSSSAIDLPLRISSRMD